MGILRGLRPVPAGRHRAADLLPLSPQTDPQPGIQALLAGRQLSAVAVRAGDSEGLKTGFRIPVSGFRKGGSRLFVRLLTTDYRLRFFSGNRNPETRNRGFYPFPLVRVLPASAFFSMKPMIMPATSLPVAVSMPSRPGEELTSITRGPWLERSRSTPATFRPMMRAALTAVERSSGVILIRLAVPPRCRLERNSPGLAWRLIEATTLSPTTKQRISAPPASLMYSWTMIDTSSPMKASRTLSAAFLVSQSTTPIP